MTPSGRTVVTGLGLVGTVGGGGGGGGCGGRGPNDCGASLVARNWRARAIVPIDLVYSVVYNPLFEYIRICRTGVWLVPSGLSIPTIHERTLSMSSIEWNSC